MSTDSPRDLKSLGFLTIGFFDEADPFGGHESTLQIIELGEQLGFDSAWLRDRHLQHGISSPVAVLAAASQRTSRIELGTAVIPLGLENPFRLAEDLSTVDVLSRGRLNPGVSVGVPTHFDDIKDHLYPDSWQTENFTHANGWIACCTTCAASAVSTFEGTRGHRGVFDAHPAPLARARRPGLVRRRRPVFGRMGGGARTQSAEQQRRARRGGRRLRRASSGRRSTSSATGIRSGQAARASQGLVVMPTDTPPAEQAAKYQAFAEREIRPHDHPAGAAAHAVRAGPRRARRRRSPMRLRAHAGYQAVDEVVFALPFTLEHDDYVQILTDIAGILGTPAGVET